MARRTIGTIEEHEKEMQFWHSVLRGDQDAVNFVCMVVRAAQVLDDLIDGDVHVNQRLIVKTFWEMLVELPMNPFYRRNELYLRPLLGSMLQDWYDSVCLERSEDLHNRTVAFVLRDLFSSLATQCAYLVGGHDWATEIGPAIRTFLHEETFEEYRHSLEAQ